MDDYTNCVGERNDPLDDPRIEAQKVMDDERYWEELDNKQRWAE